MSKGTSDSSFNNNFGQVKISRLLSIPDEIEYSSRARIPNHGLAKACLMLKKSPIHLAANRIGSP